MERYSSNLTLFYVIFLPVFWWVFFGLAVIISFIAPFLYDDVYVNFYAKFVSLTLFIIGSLILYFFVIRLKRVEANNEEIYVTNYLKHLKMPLTAVKVVRFWDFYLMRIAIMNLNFKGTWGNKIYFLERENMFEHFCSENNIPIRKKARH